MFGFKSVRTQLLEERRRNTRLQAQVQKNTSDVEYLAMMTDVEMEDVESDMNTEQEVEDYE